MARRQREERLGAWWIGALAIAVVWSCNGSELEGAEAPDGVAPVDSAEPDTVDDSAAPDTVITADTGSDDVVTDDTFAPDAEADTAIDDTAAADTSAVADTEPDDTAVEDTSALDSAAGDGADDDAGDAADDAADAGEDSVDAGPASCETAADCESLIVGPCRQASCDPDLRICVARPADEGAACEDGNLCTGAESCHAGVCVPTTPVVCADGNPCTDDTCVPAVGCRFKNNFAACDDSDPCTAGDRCLGGQCLAGTAACDDGNPCTRDTCGTNGSCSYQADDTQECSDGSDCTLGDRCRGGQCAAGDDDGCNDDSPCSETACDDDGVSCVVSLLDGVPCDDGDACTDGDRCDDGVCDPGGTINCGGHPSCIEWECDPATGCALLGVFPGAACDDLDKCTEGEVCDADGDCVAATTRDCDDANPCTVDSCTPSQGCRHSVTTGPCDDDDACTFDDRCSVGQCRGAARSCDDGDECTLNTCDPLIGCQFVPGGVICDDGSDCTTDSCDPERGCVFESTLAPCDDGIVCTVDDRCQPSGDCAGVTTTCDDADPCTADGCDPEEGCFNFSFTGPCDDGDACSEGEACGTDGRCDGAVAVDPDDGVDCTVDACDAEAGVTHAPDHTACAVGEACDPAFGCAVVTPVVVITRVMLDPDLSDDELGFGQWLVLANLTDGVLDLSGWKLRVLGGAEAALANGAAPDLLLPRRGALAAAVRTANPAPVGELAWAIGGAGDGFGFAATGERIELLDAAGAVVDVLDLTVLAAGPEVAPGAFPVAPGVALSWDGAALDGATSAAANDDAGDWCLGSLGPSEPAGDCHRARLNEVRLGGGSGDRWVELHLPAGGSAGGLSVRFVGADGKGLSARTLHGRMPIGSTLLTRDGVAGVSLPQLSSGSVQLVRSGELVDVYGFGSLTTQTDDVMGLPLVEGSAGPSQAEDTVAWRIADGADSDDNVKDWTTGPGGSPGAFNAP